MRAVEGIAARLGDLRGGAQRSAGDLGDRGRADPEPCPHDELQDRFGLGPGERNSIPLPKASSPTAGRRGASPGPGKAVVRRTDGVESTLPGKNIVIATGSEPIALPGVNFDHLRILDSTDALSLDRVPSRLLIVGAGAIGVEVGSIWHRLGSRVTLVERLDRICPGLDDEVAGALSGPGFICRERSNPRSLRPRSRRRSSPFARDRKVRQRPRFRRNDPAAPAGDCRRRALGFCSDGLVGRPAVRATLGHELVKLSLVAGAAQPL